jgi:thioredoxin 1
MKEVNTKNFDEIVIKSNQSVVIDLWAPWCAPCLIVGPILESLSENIKEVIFVKCNVDENPEIAQKYNVRGIPTFLFFNNGELVASEVGVMMEAGFKEKINKHFSL